MSHKSLRALLSAPAKNPGDSEVAPIISLWILRMLVPMGGYKAFIRNSHYMDDDLAIFLGLMNPDGDSDNDGTPSQHRQSALPKLRQQYRQAETSAPAGTLPRRLQDNIRQFSELMALSETDALLLAFVVLLHHEPLLESAAGQLGRLNPYQAARLLATLLRLPLADVRRALSPHGQLVRSGLLTLDMGHRSNLKDMFDLPSHRFTNHIVNFDTSPLDLLSDRLRPTPAPELSLADYPHLRWVKELLLPYLADCIAQRRHGVNIMLYGPPGTGKTQLALVLAQALGNPLFEVAHEDEDGDGMDGGERFSAYRSAQFLLAQRPALLLFDEAEDIFSNGMLWSSGRRRTEHASTAQSHKARTNHLLESNTVPTIWVCNSIAQLDPAFTRRFDFIEEVPVPSRAQRLRIIQAAAGPLVHDHHQQRMADSPALAPAVVSRAVNVVRAIQDTLEPDALSEAVAQLVSSTLKAQGCRPLPAATHHDPAAGYDPAFVQADTGLADITLHLRATGGARLCLYGPPGTGKTAYGHWLARQLDKPLLLKRASDILSPYVGEAEQNLALAFQEALRDDAILLLDEVDSFLQDRRRAQRSWEVTQVNEMLTQMESFPGIFIASTNLMRDLDLAALRRFDLKIRFDYLAPTQVEAMARRCCQDLDLPLPDSEAIALLHKFTKLTPGDFLVARRQHRFQPLKDAACLIRALQREEAMKPGNRTGIGFV